MFVWMMVFSRFDKLHIPDNRFGEFLKAFVSGLSNKKINGENWVEIDADKHTKDRSVINKKVDYLKSVFNNIVECNGNLEEIVLLYRRHF